MRILTAVCSHLAYPQVPPRYSLFILQTYLCNVHPLLSSSLLICYLFSLFCVCLAYKCNTLETSLFLFLYIFLFLSLSVWGFRKMEWSVCWQKQNERGEGGNTRGHFPLQFVGCLITLLLKRHVSVQGLCLHNFRELQVQTIAVVKVQRPKDLYLCLCVCLDGRTLIICTLFGFILRSTECEL